MTPTIRRHPTGPGSATHRTAKLAGKAGRRQIPVGDLNIKGGFMRRLVVLVGIVIAMLTAALPVSAITRGGEADNGEHPYVGLMVAYSADKIDHDEDPATPDRYEPLWRCSGAMISETVFVTAGHCTGPESSAPDAATPALAAVWFDEDVDPLAEADIYPWYENAVPANNAYQGVPYTHPLYVPDAFYAYDLGVVVLDGDGNTGLSEFASLPAEGAVDELGKGRKRATVTAVGYGLQKINPVMVQADRVRLQADLFVVDTNGVAGIGNLPFDPPTNSMMLSGDAKHGGTCFGDSGGPILIDDEYIAGVTSFGLNGNCAGVGGAFRIDRALELGWINSF
jgi:hypothetical protein